MYIGTSNSFFDLDEVKFIIIKDHFAEIKFMTFNYNHNSEIFEITEESFDKFLKENDVNFIKLSQKNKFSNTKTVFYVNCNKIACFINDKIYNITIKFKKSYFEDKEDTLYVDLKLNDLEFEMIKAKIAKDEKFVNI